MFHTPPPIDRTRSYLAEQSEQESYGTATSEDGSTTQHEQELEDEKEENAQDSGKVAKESVEQNGNNHENEYDALPPKLDKHVEHFIASLKEPRYATPLTADDISNLYQQFYDDFQSQAEAYLKEGLNKGSKDFQPLESFQEIADKKKERNKRSTRLQKFLEDAEAKACVMVYDKIFNMPFSGTDKTCNELIMNRVKVLRQIPITFQHLDSLEVDEAEVFPALGKAGQELHNMDNSRTPKMKLGYLLKAHKIIVQALLDGGSKSSSADLILPALIYTFIYFDTPNLWLNLHFITRFRNRSQLHGENLYCLTNFEASIRFLQSLTLEALNIDRESLPEGLDVSALYISGEVEPEKSDKTEPLSSSAAATATTTTQHAQPHTVNGERPRRLSILHPTDIADQSLKSLGSTLNSSYKFFMGKFTGDAKDANAKYPNTLEEARKVVGGMDTPPANLERNASSNSVKTTTTSNEAGSYTFMDRLMLKGLRGDDSTAAATPVGEREKVGPPLTHLLNVETEQLKVGDIHALHADYKRLVAYLKSTNAFE